MVKYLNMITHGGIRCGGITSVLERENPSSQVLLIILTYLMDLAFDILELVDSVVIVFISVH